jgi:molecular chaperone GrpE
MNEMNEMKTENQMPKDPTPEEFAEREILTEDGTIEFDVDGEDFADVFSEDSDPLALELEAVRAERDDLKDKLMRSLAEAQNIRRRAERDKKEAADFGGTKLARDLLSVHDNFARALANIDDGTREHAAGLIEGVELTQRELLTAFGKHKIEKIEPEAGVKFNPNLHQAMFEAPIPGAVNGTVIEVMQAGFTIAGRLLRPALVGVAKAAPAPVPTPTEDAAE